MEERLALHESVMNSHGYDLIKKIASGGFASVYLVNSRKYNQEFAVKVSDLSQKDGELNLNEVNALISLAHPNIINLYEHFRHNQYLYLVLEYCQRGSLEALMKERKPAIRQSLTLFHDVVSAVAACHKAGLAHRDIKPANVLIDSYGRAKLADFGLGVTGKHEELVTSNGCSIAFSPPEYFVHRAIEPFKGDVWSLGVLLYYMVEGALPWNATHATIQTQIQQGIQHIHLAIPFPVRKLIAQMTTLDPRQRITAQQVLEAPIFQCLNDKSRIPLSPTTEQIPKLDTTLTPKPRTIRPSQSRAAGMDMIKSFELFGPDMIKRRKSKAASGRLLTFNPLAVIPEEPTKPGSSRLP